MTANAEEKKGKVEEPGIVKLVRMPDFSMKAVVKTCILCKISILFYLTESLDPEEKKTVQSCRGRKN